MQGEVSDRGREYILKSTPAQWGPESSTPCGNHAFDIKARPPGTTRLLRVRGDNVSSGNVKCFDARGGEWERRREQEDNKREQGERERTGGEERKLAGEGEKTGGEGKNWRRVEKESRRRKRAGGKGKKAGGEGKNWGRMGKNRGIGRESERGKGEREG